MANTASTQYSATGQPPTLPFIIGASSVAMRACCRVGRAGGECSGAATYIAEHAPDGKRGLFTSWIQIFASASGAVFEWHDFSFTRRWHRVSREAAL